MKKVFPIVVVCVVILVVYLIFFRVERIDKIEKILYVSERCNTCQSLKETIDDENFDKKFKITIKDIDKNDNKQELATKAKQCSVDENNIVLPFFWNGDGCNIGETNIIKYLEMKAKEKK